MKNLKSLLAILILTVAVFVNFFTFTVSAEDISVLIDGKKVEFNQSSGLPFIDQANRMQVPFRQTMEQFGCRVNWDSINKIAIAEKDGITVQVPIGAPHIIKNSEKIQNDTSAIIKDGRTYLPIRAVLESFGANVNWNQDKHQVVITKDDIQAVQNAETQTPKGEPILLNAIEPVVIVKPAYNGTEYLELTVDYSSVVFNSINTPILKLVAHNATDKTVTAFEFSCKLYDSFDRPVHKVGTTDNTYIGLVQNTTLYGSDTNMTDTSIYYNYINSSIERNTSSILAGKTTVDILESDAIKKMEIMKGFYRTNIYEFNLTLYEAASKVSDFKLLNVKYKDGTIWNNPN